MAKLGLLFIVVFCVVQLALAARIVRDAPAATTATTGEGYDASKVFENAFDSIKKELENTFSKDNIDKMLSNLSQVGEKFKEVGQDIAAKVQEKTAEITKKD